jgi:uncharacterized membrane protein YphA (DoxX/SURF4 family)
MTLDPALLLVVRFALGALFVSSALHKLRDVVTFERTLGAYRLVPQRLVRPLARAVPALEAAIGLGALLQYAPAYGLAMAVLGGYAAAMAINLLRGRRTIDCGCGGDRQPISWALVVRNGVLVATAALALQPAASRALGWVDAVTVVCGVLVCALLYGAFNQVLAARARLEEWV